MARAAKLSMALAIAAVAPFLHLDQEDTSPGQPIASAQAGTPRGSPHLKVPVIPAKGNTVEGPQKTP